MQRLKRALICTFVLICLFVIAFLICIRQPHVRDFSAETYGELVTKAGKGIMLKRDNDHRPFTYIDTKRGALYSDRTD